MDQNRAAGGGAPRLPQQINVGLPLSILVFGGIAVLTLLLGSISPQFGFALFVLGLLAAVIVDYMTMPESGGGGGSFETPTLSSPAPAEQQPSSSSSASSSSHR